jgi:hypothetical protein
MSRTRFSYLIACAALPAFLLVLSCPNPIDAALARKVEDKTPPAITILAPNPAVKNYFGSEIIITGIVTDFADSAGQARGSVKSLSYEEQYNKRIHGSVTPAADGSFSFSFSTIDPEMLSGTQVIILTALDWNENKATDFVTLYDKTSGPIIVVFDHGPADYNAYSSALNAAMTIKGRVEVPTTILTYDVEPAAGPVISGQNIAWDTVSGYFQFNFNPVAAGVSGQLRFVLKAFDGKDSSTVFILTDDPVAPQITSATVAADNASVNLTFSEGVYHTGGTDPILADFTLSQVGGPASAALSDLIGAPAAGASSIDLGLAVSGQPSGAETITITGAGLTDRVGNPLSPASISRSLHDKTCPGVQQVSSTLPAGSAHKAGDVIPVTVTFNEAVTVTPPLTLALNVGAAAAYASGSGTSTITLNYTVQAGHNVDPLNYTAITDLAGTVTDLQGNPAVLTLPGPLLPDALAARNLRIDTTPPAAPGVQILDELDGLSGINKAENEAPAGVPFTVTGEPGAGYDLTLTNCSLVAGIDPGMMPPASGFALRATATGTVTVSVTLTDSAGNSSSGSDSSEANLTVPNKPVVSGPSPTNNQTPTWTWSSGGGGNGNYRYNLDNNNLSTATPTTNTFYTSLSIFNNGETHTLYVWERNEFYNWSDSGSRAILIDITPPAQPSVVIADSDGWINSAENSVGVPFTVTGESGAAYAILITNGTLKSGSATGTLPAMGLALQASAAGTVTVSVTLTDPAGNSSLLPGTDASEADLIAPGEPSVSTQESSPTTVRKPTWNWISGGEGSGNYRYELVGPDPEPWTEISAVSYQPSTNRSLGTYTLYVQERDAAGNWSSSGSATIVIE